MGPDTEVWASNNPRRAYRKFRPAVLQEWTRWFNLHRITHMQAAYPRGYAWLTAQDGSRPILLQQAHPDIPGSVAFPRAAVLAVFGTRYFTFSGAWQIALAILEGFNAIELCGFQLSPQKVMYAAERPCFFYWVDQARQRGITVRYQSEVDQGDCTIGDAAAYNGPLYGYETECDYRADGTRMRCASCQRAEAA